jgi:hypothetical protein
MSDDNGAGLRALFYGLCSFWDIGIWDEERAGEMPADFYLPWRWGAFVVITPEPAGRQVEIAALLGRQEKFIVLDGWDLDNLRICAGKEAAAAWLRVWIETGETHAAIERKRLGIAS